jgi:NUMOD3 motif
MSEAVTREKSFQKKLNVVKSPMYINKAIGCYSDNTGRKQTDEAKQKRANALRGKKHSPERCEKIRLALKGQKHTEERKRNIGLSLKGKPLSDKTKQKMSLARKNYLFTIREKLLTFSN